MIWRKSGSFISVLDARECVRDIDAHPSDTTSQKEMFARGELSFILGVVVWLCGCVVVWLCGGGLNKKPERGERHSITKMFARGSFCFQRGSNSRPSDYETDALPTAP